MAELNNGTDNIFSVINKPKNCLLLVAFPLTETDFMKDLEPGNPKDYAKMTATKFKFLPHFLYVHNHLPLVNTIRNTADTVSHYGVKVRLWSTPADLRDLAGFDVVTLVAHYNNMKQQVEFSDKLYSMEEVVANIDENFNGVFDLSVCNSTFLQDKIKSKFGDRCFVKANTELAEIKIHLILYKNVIQILDKYDTNYLTAMLNLKSQLNTYTKQINNA